MKKKNILFIVIGILLLVSAIHFFAGTTITINGKQVTGIGGYIAAYINSREDQLITFTG